MKIFLSNKLIVLLTVLSLYAQICGYACGPLLFSEDTRFSLFSPHTIENDALIPFSYIHLKQYPNKNEQLFMDREINNKEWVSYGKNAFQESEVLHIQYNTAADSFLNIAQNKDWAAFGDNDWISWLTKRKNRAALQYMIYAKEIEKNMYKTGWNTWSAAEESKNSQWPALIQKGLDELKKIKKDTFLKERYAFQVIKCAYYNALYNNDKSYNSGAIDLYREHLENSGSVVAAWSLIYIGELESDETERTKYLVSAFDKSNEKKLRARNLMNIVALENLVSQTTDAYYKEIGTVLLNISNAGRGIDEIRTVYALNPDNPYLKLMISREINKLEEWIWSYDNLKFWPVSLENRYYGSADFIDPAFSWEEYYKTYRQKMLYFHDWAIKNRQEDLGYLREFRNFLIEIARDNKIKKGYMDIAIAHLYILSSDYKEAEKVLKSMNPAQTDAIVNQYHYDKNIVMLETYDFTLQRTRDLFAMSVVDINTLSQPKLKFRYYQDYDNSDTAVKSILDKRNNVDPQFLVYTGHKLIEKGLRAEGALFIASAHTLTNEYIYSSVNDPYSYGHLSVLEKYLYPGDIDQVISYKNKKHPNFFEQIMLPAEMAAEDMYLDLKGTLYLRQKDYANALKTFERIDPDFWKSKYEFASYLPLHSVSQLPAQLIPGIVSGNGKTYPYPSKLEILKEINHFRAVIDSTRSQKTKADHQLYLANALYNISHYGEAWMAFAYGKSEYSKYKKPYDSYNWAYYSIPENEVNRLDNYYELTDAISMYQEVLSNPAADQEQKATAATMLMQCQTHSAYYNQAFLHSPSTRDGQLNTILQEARKGHYKTLQTYKNTQVYKSVTTHCPDL